MKPLEIEHRGWSIRVTSRSVGRAWSALVEVWPAGDARSAESVQVVPFNATSQSEKAVQEIARGAAIRWIDRQVKPTT